MKIPDKMQEEHQIAVIISFCSTDVRYFEKCLSEVKPFAKEILVTTSDHFFSGKKENRQLLNSIYAAHPELKFIEFAFSKDRLYLPFVDCAPDESKLPDFWHTTRRYIPFFYLSDAIEYVLYLDSDEIIERRRFCEWLDTKNYLKFDAMRYLHYYYTQDPGKYCNYFQTGGLFVKKSSLKLDHFYHDLDRVGIYHHNEGNKTDDITGVDGMPLIHHYTWIKTEEECLEKLESRAHKRDVNLEKMIQREFQTSFRTNLKLNEFEQVSIEPPYFDSRKEKINYPATNLSDFTHVTRVNHEIILEKSLQYEFSI